MERRIGPRLLLVALVLGSALAGCDRSSKATPPPNPTVQVATSTVTPSPVTTVAATPPRLYPTPGPPIPTQGEVRPAGRFLVRKNDGLWIVSLADPAQDRRIYAASSATPWSFVGAARRGALTEFFVSERAPQDTLSIVRFDERAQAPERLFTYGPTRLGEAAVSPNGVSVAYVDDTGLRLRVLPTGADYRVAPHVSWRDRACTIVQTCVTHVSPFWSPDGGVLLSRGISYEPVVTWVFDPSQTERPGTRIPLCLRPAPPWRGSSVPGDDGNCYSDPGRNFFWYDIVTGAKSALPEPSGYECSMEGIAARPTGETVTSWVHCKVAGAPYDAPGTDLVVLSRSDGTVLASTRHFPQPGDAFRAVDWLPDGSGAVLARRSGNDDANFLIDRAAQIWTLPLGGARLVAILPD